MRGILRVTRNPFFWGASLVSAGHAIILGDVAAVLAFGTVALLGLAGAPILDAKKARRHGKAWSSFGSVTSSTPFLAIAQGRQTFVLHEIGLWRIALGAGLFLAALLLHYPLFGAV